MPFYYGDPYTGWGFRHIFTKHGWSPYVEELVSVTLMAPEGSPQPFRQPDGKIKYQYFFVHRVTGSQCKMTVVTEDRPRSTAPAARGVVTAYAEEVR